MSGERLSARVEGHVQGVGYRYWTRRQARRLGLTGWVMNLGDDRAVELVAEGPRGALDELHRLLHVGPPGARVERVEARRGPGSGQYHDFEIARW
jgi:acylphosphatase